MARRLAIPAPAVKRCPWWRRLQHAFAGFAWAAVGGGGMALMLHDIMQPTRLMGAVFVTAFCVDITSSEGIAWIARTYLRLNKDSQKITVDDESRGT